MQSQLKLNFFLFQTLGEYVAPEQLSQVVRGLSTFLQEIIPVEQFDEFVINVEHYIEDVSLMAYRLRV